MDDFKVKIGAELDKSAGKQIQDGIKKVPIKPIEVPFKIDFKNSKEIEKEMNRIVSKLTNGKGSLASYKIDTSTVFDKDLGKRVEKLNGATIKYKNTLGEVISEQYKFNQIGSKVDSNGQEEAIMGWSKAMSNYGQNLEQSTKKQNTFIMKQKELSEQMKLLQIQSDKSGTTLNQENIKGFNTANTNNNIAEMSHYLKLAKTEYSQLNAMMEKDLPISGLENMKNNINNMPISIRNVETSFKKLLTQPDDLRVRIDQLNNSYKKLDAFKGDESDKVKQYNLLKTEINGVTKEVQSLIKVQQQEVTISEKSQLHNQISSYMRENTQLPKETVRELKNLQSQIKSVDKTSLNTIKKSFRELTSETKALGLTGKSTFDKFKSDLSNFTTFLGAGTVIMSGVNTVRQLVSTVAELDKSLVSLQMATGGTAEETKELLNTYIDLGQELGATGTEVADAADSYLRQGKSIAETNTLIKDSLILSKIGQLGTAEATQYLTSAMKGYKVEASGVLDIINKLSAVDLNSATSVSGLAEAMSRVANLANQAGVSMDKLLSYLATVGEVTQKDMSQIGTSFQTMFSRMGNIKIGKFVDDETGESLSDTESVLNKLDIKLRDSENTFRNFGDVLDDIGTKWGKYSDVEKNAIGVAISGVRNRENFTVLMENYSKSLDYAKISATSAGTAMEKFSAYESSVEAKTKTLQASLQELATDTLDSDVIKGFLDLANVLVNVTDNVGIFNIALTTLIGIVGAKTGFFKSFAYEIGNIMMAQTGWTASTYAQAYAQVGLTGAIKATGTAMKTFMATNPIGWILGITAAIAGLFAIQDALTTSLKEQQEKTEKLQYDYSGLETELNSMNSELKTTIDRIDELNAKDSLTIVEQDELDNLKETNTLLESQIRLLQQQADIKNREVADSVAKEYNKDFGEEYQSLTKSKQYTANGTTYNTPDVITQEEYVKELISEYEQLNKMDKSLMSENDLTKLEKYKTSLVNYGVEFNDYADRYKIDDETSQSWRDFATLIDKTLNPAEYKQTAFDELFNSKDFAYAKSELEAMAKAGTLDESVITSNEKYKTLLTETGATASEVVSNIKALSSANEQVTTSTYDSETAIKALNDALTNLSSSDKALTDLKTMVKDFGAISMDTITNLSKEYPQLTDVLNDYLSGVASTTDVINALSDVYETDMHNWQILIISKYENNEEFLNQVGGHSAELINQMKNQYGIDLSNNKTYLEDKMDILNTYLGGAGGAWLKYYDIASGKTQNLGGLSSGEQYYISKQATLANQALATFNQGLDFSGIETNFETANGDFKTTKADKAKKAAEEAEKKRQEAIQKVKDKFAKEDDANKFLLDTGKIDESEYYKRLKSLNKKFFQDNKDFKTNGLSSKDFLEEDRQNQVTYYKWSQDQAEEAAKKQEDIAENLKDKYKDIISDIADEIEKEKDAVLDNLEKSHDAIIDSLEKEKENYKEIVETQLELLDAKKKQEDYEKSIAKQTKEISAIEKRKAELELAAKSGDRTAIAELAKLDEELVDKKDGLLEDQKDHELDLQKESLNNALDLNDKLLDARIDAENSRFETQKQNIETLYNKEIELISKAAQYTKTEFSKALDEVATGLSSNGVTQSSSYLGSVKQTQSSVAGTEINTSTSNRSAILAILANGTGKDYGSEASALNAYVRDTYGAPISNAQAAQIASMLGVSGINSADDVKGNDKNKNKILEALRKAGFRNGGYVNTSGTLSSLIKQSGEDGIALVRHGEPILSVEQGKLFKELVGNLQPLNNLVKLSSPNISNLVTNNNSSPTTIQVTVPVTGSIDSKNATAVGNNIAQQVAKAIIDVKRTK